MENMSKPEEEMPLIYKEADELLQNIESGEAQIQQSEELLESKEAYLQELQQQCADFEKSLPEKSAKLAIIKKNTSFVANINSCDRETVNKLYASGNKITDEDAKNLEITIAEADERVEKLEKVYAKEISHYEKEVDDLTKLLNQQTEKRKKKLEAVELETKQLEQENLDLNDELFKLEYEEELLGSENYSDDSSELEMEVSALQEKLKILEDEYLLLTEEEKSLGEREKEFLAKYSEEEYEKINQSFLEVCKETANLRQNIQDQQTDLNSALAEQSQLTEYEQELDKQLTEATKACELMNESQYEENSKLDQAIEKIKADIMKEKEKYDAFLAEKTANSEILKETEDQITKFTPEVDLIAAELSKVGSDLKDLEIASDIAGQFGTTSNEVIAIDEEILALQELVLQKKNLIETYQETLATSQGKFDLELLSLQNSNSMEIKEIEQKITELTNFKIEANEKVNTMNAQIKEVEEIIKKNQANLETLEENTKHLEDMVDIKKQQFKDIVDKNRELIKTLDALKPYSQSKFKPALSQDSTTRSETSQKASTKSPNREKEMNFMRPKTPESVRHMPLKTANQPPKKAPKKQQSRAHRDAKAKRNWDSDSSAEDMERFQNYLLKKKKRQEQEKEQ